MTKAHDLPAPIQWHEGMLLAPQHFQQLCLRQEKLLHYHLTQASAFHHGVCRLRFDPALLFEGTLRILELEAVMPDGLVVSYQPGQAGETLDLQVDVKPHAEAAKHAAVPVYLAVPSDRFAGGNFDGDLGRYSSFTGDPINDETSGERPLRIPRLRPRLRLLATTEPPPSRFTSMQIMAVRFKNGAFLASDYIPPTLQTATDSALGELCAQVSRRIREKGMYLVEIIRSPAITTKPEVIEENRRLISYLMANLPPFEALLATGRSHPYELYVALCGIAGAVAAIGNQMIPPLFPAYDHDRPRVSFEIVRDFIYSTIDEGISEAFTSIPLRYDSGTFTLNFEREWLGRVVVIGAKGAPGMSDQQILDWMNASLIGTASRFRILRERRLLGAGRQPIDRYEGLVATRGTLLFQLKVDPEFIVANEPLQVGQGAEKAGAPRPAELYLYVANKG